MPYMLVYKSCLLVTWAISNHGQSNGWYLQDTPPKSYDNAISECKGRGMQLAILNSQAEFDGAVSYIESNGPGVDQIWIGFRIHDTSTEEFRWINGEIMKFPNWVTNQPNYFGADSCGKLRWTSGGLKFAHDRGSTKDAFLCADVDVITTTEAVDTTTEEVDTTTESDGTTTETVKTSTVAIDTTTSPVDTTTEADDTTTETVKTSTGTIDTTTSTVDTTTEPDYTTTETVKTSTGTINTTTGPVDTTTEADDTTTETVKTSTVAIDTTTGPVDTTTEVDDTTTETVKTSTVAIDTTTSPVDTTTEPVDTTTETVKISTGAIDTTTGPVDTTTEADDTTTETVKTSTVAIDTTTSPVDTTTKADDTTTEAFKTFTVAIDTTTGPVDTTTESMATATESADFTLETVDTTTEGAGGTTVVIGSTAQDPGYPNIEVDNDSTTEAVSLATTPKGENATIGVDVCSCGCSNAHFVNDYHNYTFEELKKMLSPITEYLRHELLVDKTALSAYINKRKSKEDGRPSAQRIGYGGATVLIIVGVLIIFADLSTWCRK